MTTKNKFSPRVGDPNFNPRAYYERVYLKDIERDIDMKDKLKKDAAWRKMIRDKHNETA
jgi:hypothetical protein